MRVTLRSIPTFAQSVLKAWRCALEVEKRLTKRIGSPDTAAKALQNGLRFAEAITMAYHRHHSLDTKIVRIFNTYGPRMRLKDGRVVPAFISQALNEEPVTVFGDGSQTRSFCYVSDLIDGIFRLAMSEYHEPINIGNPREMTILRFRVRNPGDDLIFQSPQKRHSPGPRNA